MPKKSYFLLFTLYFLLSLLFFRPVIGSFFVSDDFDWLVRARDIPAADYFLNNADGHRQGGVYRPLTTLSFWLNYRLNGLNPAGYHLFNILFHALNGFLVFFLARVLTRVFSGRGPDEVSALRADFLAPFFAGLFFIAFPNRPEAVSWISGRGDVLVVFFYLFSLIAYLFFRNGRGLRWLALSLISFILALFSKEMALTLPAILIVYELAWRKKEPFFRKQFLPLLIFALSLGVYFFLRFYATGLFYGFYANSRLDLSFLRLGETFWASLFSHFLSGRPRAAAVGFAAGNLFWLTAIFSAAILFLFWRLRKIGRRLFFSASIFVVGLGPIYYLAFSRLTDEGDRFVYLPSAGTAIFLAFIFCLAPAFSGKKMKKAAGVVAAALLFFYFGANLYQKNLDWAAAGSLSGVIVEDFFQKSSLAGGGGAVILGLPDNIAGAPVFRNGWLNALKLFYPQRVFDVLAIKAGLNLPSEGWANIAWRGRENGFQAASFSPAFFHGPQKVQSLDYEMEISGYDKNVSSGREISIIFTREFISQMESKKIAFFVLEDGRWREVFLSR